MRLPTPRKLPKPSQLVLGTGIFLALFVIASGIIPVITQWHDTSTVQREVFTNVPQTLDEYFLNDPKGYYNLPDYSYYTNQVGAGIFATQTGLDNYAARVSGLFMAPSIPASHSFWRAVASYSFRSSARLRSYSGLAAR